MATYSEHGVSIGGPDDPAEQDDIDKAADDLEAAATEPEPEPDTGEDDNLLDDAEAHSALVEMITTVVGDTVPGMLEVAAKRVEQRNRDRAYSTMAELTARITSLEDHIEEAIEERLPAAVNALVSEALEEVHQAIDDLGDRMRAVEEACGLRPSLLTTAESAVARLDEMAQGGTLRANEIRSIHRALRAAVQQERAAKQR